MSRFRLSQALILILGSVFVTTSFSWDVEAKKKKSSKKESKDDKELGQESAAIMSAHLAANEMQRYYEVVRVAPDLSTRGELVERMRTVLESRVTPLTANRDLLAGGAVACSPDSKSGLYGCFPRDVALSYLYFGLARASQGLPTEVDAYSKCATDLYPGAAKETIYLSKPPIFQDDYSGDLAQTRLEAYPFYLTIERERARWPRDVRSISFDLIPSPELLPKELRIAQTKAATQIAKDPTFDSETTSPALAGSIPVFGLEELVIEPVAVDSKHADYYAAVASQDLRRVLSRVYLYDWSTLGTETSTVCPDPRMVHLPEGRYVLYMKGTNDFAQFFTVGNGANEFLLEYFYIGNFESGTARPRIAWYKRANLCGGKACQ